MKTTRIAWILALGLMTCLTGTIAADLPISEKVSEDGEGLVIGARDPKVFNEIDRFVLARLRSESIDPSPICTDSEFVRRVYIDVVGVVPTGEEAKAFLNDSSPNKRSKLIDKLLNDGERYADHWEVMWGDWLREHSVANKKEGTVQGSYRGWLRGALKNNMPYDQFARKLMTSSGTAAEDAAVNFYLRDSGDRVETVNTVSQAFMGSRMACAQCHDHPFDKWTQTDFHGLMAFFGQTKYVKPPKKDKVYGEAEIHDDTKGEYHMPADGDSANKKGKNSGEVVKPVFAWNPAQTGSGAKTRREALANAVIGSPRFAQVQANRLWSQLMGRGIVEPPDDFREKNPPTHPELLEFLTDQLVKSKYDNKHVLRLILNSATYQRSSIPTDGNRSDSALFSHQRVRRMTAEELFDSILVAAGHDKGLSDVPASLEENNKTAAKKGGKGMGKKNVHVEWAADLPTPSKTGTFMNVFNQPPRNVLITKREESGAVTQALEMLNGKAVNDALETSPLLDHLFASKTDARHAVTELFMATLTRPPTSEELEKSVKGADATREWLVDLQWALLNSREFTFVK